MRHVLSYYRICDLILNTLDSAGGNIEREAFEGKGLPYYEEVFPFLVGEGLLEESPDSFKITYKGRIAVNEGGLKGRYIRRTVIGVCSIVAAVAALASLTILLL